MAMGPGDDENARAVMDTDLDPFLARSGDRTGSEDIYDADM